MQADVKTIGRQAWWAGWPTFKPPHYPYINRRSKGARNKKARQAGLEANLPGLTADTTVFAIDRAAEMNVRKAGGKGLPPRVCRESSVCCNHMHWIPVAGDFAFSGGTCGVQVDEP